MLLAPVAMALGEDAAPAAPQTQPAAAVPAQPAQPAKIVVLPFETVGGKPGDAWIARSIQQSVLTDLMTASRSQVLSSVAPAADSAAAAELGHKLGARYVVFGQVHVNENSMRVTGQIVSTDTDSVVGTLKATGAMNDLFTLEDVLSNEARGAVARLEGPASAIASQQPPAIQATGPVQVVPYPQDSAVPYAGAYDASPAYPIAPYDGGYPYDYYPNAYYPYAPLYFYGGIGFGRGFRGHSFGGRGGLGGGLHGGGLGGHGGGLGGHGGIGGHAGGGHGGGGHR